MINIKSLISAYSYTMHICSHKLHNMYEYATISNNNSIFYLQVASSPSKPRFKANLSKQIFS